MNVISYTLYGARKTPTGGIFNSYYQTIDHGWHTIFPLCRTSLQRKTNNLYSISIHSSIYLLKLRYFRVITKSFHELWDKFYKRKFHFLARDIQNSSCLKLGIRILLKLNGYFFGRFPTNVFFFSFKHDDFYHEEFKKSSKMHKQ